MKGFEPLRHHSGLFNQTFVWSQAYPFTSTDYTDLSTYPKIIKVLLIRFPRIPHQSSGNIRLTTFSTQDS